MKKEFEKSETKVVLPGEFLSTGEEFVPGRNAFDSGSNVYSNTIGFVQADNKTKEISVKPAVELHALKRGSIVLGRVGLVKENSVLIGLCKSPGSEERQILASGRAFLPVRNVSREYVENLSQCFKIGDIVKARVSEILPGNNIDLETNQPDFGVLKAFCSRCRKPLHLFGTSLRCINCGSSEERKIAKGYLVK